MRNTFFRFKKLFLFLLIEKLVLNAKMQSFKRDLPAQFVTPFTLFYYRSFGFIKGIFIL
jgi:hypothetical protein